MCVCECVCKYLKIIVVNITDIEVAKINGKKMQDERWIHLDQIEE